MVTVPEGVNLSIEGNKVTAKGPKGEVSKSVSPKVSVKMKDKDVVVEGKNHAFVKTTESVISGMFRGVTEGFEKKLKVVYAHFPVTVEVKGNDILIKNFQGEKHPRKTVVVGGTKVEVKGQNITISGPDREAVGQTAANLKAVTRIKGKDGRVFQDGIYDALEG